MLKLNKGPAYCDESRDAPACSLQDHQLIVVGVDEYAAIVTIHDQQFVYVVEDSPLF